MTAQYIPLLLLIVPLAPLLASVINALLYGWTNKTGNVGRQYWTVLVSIAFLLLAITAHCLVHYLHPTLNGEGTATIVAPTAWVSLQYPLRLDWAIRFDALTSVMVPVVLFVGLCVHIFSVGYFHDRKEDIARYYAWISFFMFSMLLLVVAANLFVFFVGWELVGLSSYKLISFYMEKEAAQRAGKKSFILNRIGDAAFLLAFFAIMQVSSSVQFRDIVLNFSAGSVAAAHSNFIAIMVFIAVAAKSAQIPLYTWLPDAMTGPTPVSALIHAATMVTAGIFFMLRLEPVLIFAPEASTLIAFAGALTALLGAYIALTQNDIKKVLAYSTVSQLGLMVLAVGSGAYSVAFFHLFTHAFFKALLFLGAGAVITYSHHEQNIRRMGGLAKKYPALAILFWIGLAALAGLPGFSGYFSKDHILASSFLARTGGPLLASIVVLVSVLTAFYSFRLGLLVFHGKPRGNQPHEENSKHPLPTVSFYLPLILLGIPALLAGFIAMPAIFTGQESGFMEYLNRNLATAVWESVRALQAKAEHRTEWLLILFGTGAALLGAVSALVWYGFLKKRPVAEGAHHNGFLRGSLFKLYVDEIYDFCFVRPYKKIGDKVARLETEVTPKISEGVGALTQELAQFFARLQNGSFALYALYALGGILALLTLAMGIL